MHVPIKFISNPSDLTQTNEPSDLSRDPKKFEDSFLLAQCRTSPSDSEINEEIHSLLKFANLHSEVNVYHFDIDKKPPPINDVYNINHLELLGQVAEKSVTFDNEVHGIAGVQFSETFSLETKTPLLKGREGQNENSDITLSSDLVIGVDPSHLILSENATFSYTTTQTSSDYSTIKPYSDNTLLSVPIPTTKLVESSSNIFEKNSIENKITNNPFIKVGFARYAANDISEKGNFFNKLVPSNPLKSNGIQSFANILNILSVSGQNSEKFYAQGPNATSSWYDVSETFSTNLTLKTNLKLSVSNLTYSIVKPDSDIPATNDLNNVLQSMTFSTSNSLAKSKRSSVQFGNSTTFKLTSKNEIQFKNIMDNFTNSENEYLRSDSSRHDDVTKLSNFSSLEAQVKGDDKINKTISVDSPRAHKLDMSLSNWMKVLNSQISKGALENITKLEFAINPKKLGRISVSLQMDAGNVNVSILSSNGHVANILQTSEGKLETFLSDHGMKLASYNVNSDQNGRERRDREPTNGRKGGMVEGDGPEATSDLTNEIKSNVTNTHNGDYDYLV